MRFKAIVAHVTTLLWNHGNSLGRSSGFILLPRSVDLLVECHRESHTKELGKEKHVLKRRKKDLYNSTFYEIVYITNLWNNSYNVVRFLWNDFIHLLHHDGFFQHTISLIWCFQHTMTSFWHTIPWYFFRQMSMTFF